MKHVPCCFVVLMFVASSNAQVSIKAAGSSWVCSLMNDMFTSGGTGEYSCNGAQAAESQFDSNTIDMWASVSHKKQEGVTTIGLLGVPLAFGFNMQGISAIVLDLNVLVKIFLGDISNWKHPDLAALNPSQAFPNSTINLVFSNTSDSLNDIRKYLASSPAWPHGAGSGWPAGLPGTWYTTEQQFLDSLSNTAGSFGFSAFNDLLVNKISFAVLNTEDGTALPGWEDLKEAVEHYESEDGVVIQENDHGYPIIGITYLLYRTDNPKLCAITDFIYKALISGKGTGFARHYMTGLSDNVLNMGFAMLHHPSCVGSASSLTSEVNLRLMDNNLMEIVNSLGVQMNDKDESLFLTHGVNPTNDGTIYLGYKDSPWNSMSTYLSIPLAIQTLDLVVNFQLDVVSMELEINHVRAILTKNITTWLDPRLSEKSTYVKKLNVPVVLVADASLTNLNAALRELSLSKITPDVILPSNTDVVAYIKSTPGAVAFIPTSVSSAAGLTRVNPLNEGELYDTAAAMEHSLEELQFDEEYRRVVPGEHDDVYPFYDMIFFYVKLDVLDPTNACGRGHVALLEGSINEEGQELLNHHFGLVSVATYVPVKTQLKLLKCNGALYFPPPSNDDVTEAIKLASYVISGVIFVGMLLGVLTWWKKSLMAENIFAAENIAAALARFDLVTAESVLGECKKLPVELNDAFLKLITNLASYRAYLPESCLRGDSSSEEEESDTAESEKPCNNENNNNVVKRKSGMTSCAGSSDSKANRRLAEIIRTKKVTLGLVNLLGLHKNSQNLFEKLEKYASIISKISTENKAIRDVMLGDRMYLSWNGARHLANHVLAAGTTALQIASEMKNHGVQTSMGLVAGTVKCGVVGAEQIKRFTFIGAMVPWVCVMERLNKICYTSIMVSGIEFLNSFYTRKLAFVDYKKLCSEPIMVHELLHEKEETNEEWMYAMQDAESKNPCADFNSAMENYFSGNYGVCGNYMRQQAPEVTAARWVLESIEEMERNGHAKPPPITSVSLSEVM